ncbi:short-subunit dehydrogenase [Catalinimonas alkaloidigena]|uniref:SDR family oxidoreductase n=1 Tax=Catalinimonas alkaloidigena TaxID=1075417 RepID=UPI002404ED42|nr:SDR family oxidoreductase [Catalinimonas alkaloidigena]MDF9799659.1 short-subunit dehydrogenase [Catalinimonas alkaloidigena]
MSVIHLSNVVVITGASGGVGRATAREFARKGYKVALLARGKEGLEGASKDVEALGGKALAIQLDLANAEEVEGAAERIEEELGPISIWVNNAMNSVFSPVKEMKAEEYKRVTEVTYLGQVYGTLAAYKRMRKRNSGSIILVGSALAFRGIPLQSAYCASKHAIQGFFDSFRSELIHDESNINVSMIQLPAMNTTQFAWVKSRLPMKGKPMGKIYQPEVAARAIFYAAHHQQRSIYVGSATAQTIVGNKFFPGLLDHYLAKVGYTGQQTDEAEEPGRPHNLWEPIKEDRGSHGSFDSEATDYSLELQATTTQRNTTLAVLATGLLAAITLLWVKKN